MRTTLTVDLFVSADGWAGSDGLPGYFGYLGPELEEWMAGESAAPQISIMGRRTYEVLAALPEEHRDEDWARMTRLPAVVFSRTLTQAGWPGARVHPGELIEEIRQLKAQSDVPLRTIGSLSVPRQLITAGLVDRARGMRLTTITNVSVDGAIQGLGGSDEDRSGGFERGGWALPLFDDEAEACLSQVYRRAAAFLFGRRTYEIFAASWGTGSWEQIRATTRSRWR